MPQEFDATTTDSADVPRRGSGPLHGIRVLDISTVYAAPITAMLLGDFGAEVIKIEHPVGDPGPLTWREQGRPRSVVEGHLAQQAMRHIELGCPEGQRILRELVTDADVLVENFRPGVLEKWGLGPDRLQEINPGLVMLRVTGFGQIRAVRERRAFGTLAEAMSGFAHQTGRGNGPPTLPPFGLADGVAGITGAFAVMTALYHRDSPGGDGRAKSSTCHCWSRWSASSARAPARSINSAPSPAATATARRTTPRATPTSPKTVAGWRSRPALRRSPNGSCGWSGAPTWSRSRGSPRRASAAATVTCSTTRSRNGSRPTPARGERGIRAGRRRVGADLRRRTTDERPTRARPRNDHHRRRRRPRPVEDAEPDVPHAGHTRARSGSPAAASARTTTRSTTNALGLSPEQITDLSDNGVL